MDLCLAFFRWKMKRSQRQKIKIGFFEKKSVGQVDVVVGMFLVCMTVVVVLFGFRTQQYMLISDYVEDALAASNLASAVIDLEEYGKNHKIWIK